MKKLLLTLLIFSNCIIISTFSYADPQVNFYCKNGQLISNGPIPSHLNVSCNGDRLQIILK